MICVLLNKRSWVWTHCDRSNRVCGPKNALSTFQTKSQFNRNFEQQTVSHFIPNFSAVYTSGLSIKFITNNTLFIDRFQLKIEYSLFMTQLCFLIFSAPLRFKCCLVKFSSRILCGVYHNDSTQKAGFLLPKKCATNKKIESSCLQTKLDKKKYR